MRVQLVSSALLPSAGGAYTYYDDLFQAFLECAHESRHEFFILDFLGGRPSRELPANVEWVTLSRGLQQQVWGRCQYELRRLRQKLNGASGPQIIERAHEKRLREKALDYEFDLTLSWTPSGINPWCSLPHITTVWDLGQRTHPYFPEYRANHGWERLEDTYRRLPLAAKVICGTQTLKEQIVRYYGVSPCRVAVIPFATPSFALEAAPDKLSTPPRFQNGALPSQYLFYPAQFWAHKNHVGLLHALRILRDQHGIRLPVVFCGSDKGNLEYVQESAVRLKLDTDVSFLGFVTREELVWLYRHAWALAYVSFIGPDNLPPLEAFALGCPVLAANVEGATEQLGDAALLVDPANAGGIAAAVKRLFESEAFRQDLIARGHKRAEQFTARDYIRTVLGLLDDFEPLRRCWR